MAVVERACWDVSVILMRLSWRDVPISRALHSGLLSRLHSAAPITCFGFVHLFTCREDSTEERQNTTSVGVRFWEGKKGMRRRRKRDKRRSRATGT